MADDDSKQLGIEVGPYRIEQLLGRGGMGEVYRAFDQRLQRRVALKKIRAEREEDPRTRQRFLREARAAARLSHANIAQVYDILELEDELWIVMEWVSGQSLRDRLDLGPLANPEALRLAEELAQGLTAAHAEGVVHRDLKPDNVMLTTSGSVKILDFGLAKLEPLGDGESATLTRVGTVLGTPRSMAPEQALGHKVDHRADFFALGVLLYEAVTGVAPFRGPSAEATLRKICVETPVPVRVRAPMVPAHLEALIEALLEKERGHRPASGSDILKRLADPEQAAGEVTTPFQSDLEQLPTIALANTLSGDDASIEDSTLPAGVDHHQDHQEESGESVPSGRTSIEASALGSVPQQKNRSSFFETAERKLPGFAIPMLFLVISALVIWTLAPWLSSLRTPSKRLSIAVLQPSVAVGEEIEGMDLFVGTLRDEMLRALTSFRDLYPLAPSEVDEIVGPPTAIARATGADEILETKLRCQFQDCRAELLRIRGADGGLLESRVVDVPLDDFLNAAKAVRAGLRQAYPGKSTEDDPTQFPTNPQDFNTFVQIQRSFETRSNLDLIPTFLDQLEAVRKRSPRFTDAYLLESQIAKFSFIETREPEMLKRALELLDQAQMLSPRSLEPLIQRFRTELVTGQIDRAQTTLERLESSAPGDIRVLDLRAALLEQQGHIEEALAIYRSTTDRRPSWKRHVRCAELADRLGKLDLARESLQALLALSPGNARGISQLARIELRTGNFEHAVSLFSELVEKSSTPTRLINLGIAQMFAGDFSASAKTLEQALASAPKSSLILINLADAKLLNGQTGEAEDLYRRVLQAIEEDPAEDVSLLLTKAQALARLERHAEAEETLQKAVALGTNPSETAYAATYVYAASGNLDAAEANAKKALALGYDRLWFDLPWFDQLSLNADSPDDRNPASE